MICLDTNAANLLTFEFWNERADIIMAVVAVLALMLTLQQLRSGRQESRRATAYATYQEYLKNCADNPKFAYGNKNDIVSNGVTHEKYPWFVSQMLFTFEQVLETSKSDKQWRTAIQSQLEKHAWYLERSNTIKRNEWSDDLMTLIRNVLACKKTKNNTDRR
ncbi:hypothetical protein R7D64_01305 [Vibrio sp. Vb2535]|uniref:hypothetical protein n=1 Tax=Vibrio TaxID=662 RepID=UPI0006CC2B48|nr:MULTISPECIES: hypothetical protein [Vibrio]AXN34236.1 hypothetical protein DVV14_23695 [Vibrio coralliilyticus]KPH24230.1 hypothetical protein ADU60_22810 [Vibrio coralliilyticus]MCG9662945.1 hypothetical protein [Vibrio mediterranei]MDW1751524.1 hypothetical protein [Vibrio sp. Vb2535]OQT99951.1 hypothetical protein EM85_009630 [Vibrio parahaemolyticus]